MADEAKQELSTKLEAATDTNQDLSAKLKVADEAKQELSTKLEAAADTNQGLSAKLKVADEAKQALSVELESEKSMRQVLQQELMLLRETIEQLKAAKGEPSEEVSTSSARQKRPHPSHNTPDGNDSDLPRKMSRYDENPKDESPAEKAESNKSDSMLGKRRSMDPPSSPLTSVAASTYRRSPSFEESKADGPDLNDPTPPSTPSPSDSFTT